MALLFTRVGNQVVALVNGTQVFARGQLLSLNADRVAAKLPPLRTLAGFGYPEGIAADGDKVYVVNWMDDNVSVLDAESGRSLARIDTGRNSRGFGAFIGAPATP